MGKNFQEFYTMLFLYKTELLKVSKAIFFGGNSFF